MANDAIEEGDEAFISDNDKPFGAVRALQAHDIIIYVENAGDFTVPRTAVHAVHSHKVILDAGRLDKKLQDAIRRAHAAEDPNI